MFLIRIYFPFRILFSALYGLLQDDENKLEFFSYSITSSPNEFQVTQFRFKGVDI